MMLPVCTTKDALVAGVKGLVTNIADRLIGPLAKRIAVLEKAVAEKSDDAMQALEQRVATLEPRPSLDYRGVFDPNKDYRAGDLVSHGGSMHYCHTATRGAKPGESEAWQLCVKRGRDGKDAK